MNHSHISSATRRFQNRNIYFLLVLLFPGLGIPAFSQTETKSEEPIFMIVEQQPEFPGGDEARRKFFSQNLKTPKSATNAKGKVFVSFVVNKDGTLQDQTLFKSLSDEYDQEALRVVKLMPKWIPGRQSGRALRVRCILPVEFR
nr:TonB family protein [uncultured Dyadobacter sp.]